MRRATIERIGFGVIVFETLLLASIGTFVRFSYPDLTETQLFLHAWPLWIGGAVLLIASAWIYRYAYDKSETP